MRSLLILGAVLCAVSVTAGAFGAHGLKARLDAVALGQWETAARYLMYAGLGAVLSGLAALRAAPSTGFGFAGWSLVVGGLIFAAAVGGLALGAPRWFGAVAPLGGLGMIVGFLAFAFAASRLG
ncbi:MAG: DUF423 domain-containing protein [Acidobacteriota bacterium]